MKKNVLFILLDGCEYSTFENSSESYLLAPNISNLIKSGIQKKIISNGMITQVALPPILTQTYPLDFGGFNEGIKKRPRSITEILKKNGYETLFISGHGAITGPRREFERGSNHVKSIFDFDDTIEDFIRHIIYYEFKRFDEKKISKRYLINIIKNQFANILKYAIDSYDRVDYFFLPRRLKKPTKKTITKLKEELKILKSNPEEIIKKLKLIPSRFYSDFLGTKFNLLDKKKISKKIKFKKKLYSLREKLNGLFRRKTGLGFSPFAIYVSPTASELFKAAKNFLIDHNDKVPWFIFMQCMDIHDGPKTCRLFNFIFKLQFIPRLLKIRKNYKTHRDFWRDLSLIYLDHELGNFIKVLKKKDILKKTVFYLFGDHGMGWDARRDQTLMNNLGARTYYEHIEVPLIISPCKKSTKSGIHDSMSISASLLDDLGLRGHSSFRGKSVFSKGNLFSLVENTARGYCDVNERDIFFTVTTKNFKCMFVLIKNQLYPMRLYNKISDPHEYINILEKKFEKDVVDSLALFLIKERKELLDSRGVDVKEILSRKKKWIIKEYKSDTYSSPRYYKKN